MDFDSSKQALDTLKDTRINELQREEAIQFLKKDPTPDVIEALIAVLDDDDFGVSWTASAVLAELGTIALAPLFQTLMKRADNVRVRRGIYHALHYNTSNKLPGQTGELMRAIKGPAPDIVAPEIAFKCLQELEGQAR